MTKKIAHNIRFSANTEAALKAAAQATGVPLATYVREAALLRAAYDMGLTAGIGYERDADPALIEPVRQAVLEAVREHLSHGFDPEP